MSVLTTLLRIDRSSKELWAANIQCMTPPLEWDGPWKTRQLFRMIIRSWTTCWVNWGTDGTLFVASQSKGKDASPHICCCNLTQLTTSCTIQCFCRILYLLLTICALLQTKQARGGPAVLRPIYRRSPGSHRLAVQSGASAGWGPACTWGHRPGPQPDR